MPERLSDLGGGKAQNLDGGVETSGIGIGGGMLAAKRETSLAGKPVTL